MGCASPGVSWGVLDRIYWLSQVTTLASISDKQKILTNMALRPCCVCLAAGAATHVFCQRHPAGGTGTGPDASAGVKIQACRLHGHCCSRR